jgi:putative addiction module killer protein
MTFILKKYQLASGKVPFDEWLATLSPVFRARVHANLARVEVGNWGNVKSIKGADVKDLYELRMFFGPGFRAYFGKDGSQLVMLLCGGDKTSQRKDISAAKRLWKEYIVRKGE